MRATPWLLGSAALLCAACASEPGPLPPTGDSRTGKLEFGTRADASPDLSFDTGPLPDVDIGSLPNPSCAFLTPQEGATIADDQTYAEVQTRYAPQGTVVAMLVDFVPQTTTVVGAEGKAEFVTVPLPAPSARPVELRAEVRLYPMHKVSCWIHITVAAKP
jgi:hypothetical protein